MKGADTGRRKLLEGRGRETHGRTTQRGGKELRFGVDAGFGGALVCPLPACSGSRGLVV